MPYLLNAIYLLILIFLSPWLLYKSLTTGKYRRGLWCKFSGSVPRRSGSGPCAWFHGVSVGEIHLLREVIARFRQRHPDWHCVLSTTTDTGFDEAARRFPDLSVFYWPLDFTWAVKRALRRAKPSLIVLAEGELWPNFLATAWQRGVPVAQINGRMSPRSFRRHQRFAFLGHFLFRKLALIAAQTEEYAAYFRKLGASADRVMVSGSVKYDGVETSRFNPRTQEVRRLFALTSDDLVLVAGSTQAPEEELILDLFKRVRQQHPRLRLLLVPRQKDRFEGVASLLRDSGMPFVRRSALKQPLPKAAPVILVDTIGELSAVWGLADVAFVGGSLDGKRGGQNMIEPAAYGAAVLFGPHVWNFKETAARLLEQQAAIQVANATMLENETVRLLSDAAARSELGTCAQRFVLSQQGATDRTMAALANLITQNPPTAHAA
jgi:3-deoxy-D-manno-octulosonic-acid transferase